MDLSGTKACAPGGESPDWYLHRAVHVVLNRRSKAKERTEKLQAPVKPLMDPREQQYARLGEARSIKEKLNAKDRAQEAVDIVHLQHVREQLARNQLVEASEESDLGESRLRREIEEGAAQRSHQMAKQLASLQNQGTQDAHRLAKEQVQKRSYAKDVMDLGEADREHAKTKAEQMEGQKGVQLTSQYEAAEESARDAVDTDQIMKDDVDREVDHIHTQMSRLHDQRQEAIKKKFELHAIQAQQIREEAEMLHDDARRQDVEGAYGRLVAGVENDVDTQVDPVVMSEFKERSQKARSNRPTQAEAENTIDPVAHPCDAVDNIQDDPLCTLVKNAKDAEDWEKRRGEGFTERDPEVTSETRILSPKEMEQNNAHAVEVHVETQLEPGFVRHEKEAKEASDIARVPLRVPNHVIVNEEATAENDSKNVAHVDDEAPTAATRPDPDEDIGPVALLQLTDEAGFVTLHAAQASVMIDDAAAEIDKTYSKRAAKQNSAVEHNLEMYQRMGAKEAATAWHVAQAALNAQVTKDTRFEAKEPLTIRAHSELINAGGQQILEDAQQRAREGERQAEHDLRLQKMTDEANLNRQMAELQVTDQMQAATMKPIMARALREADPHMPMQLEQEGWRYSEKNIKSQQKRAISEVDYHEKEVQYHTLQEMRALNVANNEMSGERKAVDAAVDPIINGKTSDTRTIPAHAKWYTPGDGAP